MMQIIDKIKSMTGGGVYVVELGTRHITIYRGAVVLHEPSLIAIKRDHGLRTLAVGSKVFDLPADPTGAMSIITPIEEGAVVNEEAAVMMVEAMLAKVIPQKMLRTPLIVLSIPSGLTSVERERLESVVKRAGYPDVVSCEMLNGLRELAPVEDGKPQDGLFVILGGGTTDIGILNRNSIVSACTLNIGGRTIDEKIANQIKNTHFLRIGLSVAERLKIEAGSLFAGDRTTAFIVGQDMIYGSTAKREIVGTQIRPGIQYCFERILDVAGSLITTIPVASKNTVVAGGVTFAGGGANMRGLQEFTKDYLHMGSKIVNEPEVAHLRGIYNLYSK